MSRIIINTMCAAIGVGSLATGAFVAIYPAEVRTMLVPHFQLARLQHLAEQSCRCEREPGRADNNACWAEFDRKMPPPRPPGTDWMTACDPVSTTTRCGPRADILDGDCVTTRYEYFTSDGHRLLLCSQKEASAVETTWMKTSRLLSGGRVDSSVADKLARDIIAGRSIHTATGPSLCTSS